MFEAFSRGYYLGRLYVEPYDGDHAVMQRAQHDRVNEQLYAPSAGGDAADQSRPDEGLAGDDRSSADNPVPLGGNDADSTDPSPADPPLVMKLDGVHFPVGAAGDVPNGTLGLPESLLEGCGIENPPALEEILLARAERARQLLQWFGRSGWPGNRGRT